MLKALGTKLIVRPVPPHSYSDGGIALLPATDLYNHKVYYVVSAGPKVTITGLSHGCRVLCTAYDGVGFDWEGHPLRVIDESEVLMLLDEVAPPLCQEL